MKNGEKPTALVACDKFKGSLSAVGVAEAVEAGLGNGWHVEKCPIADGGEGFVDAMLTGAGGRKISVGTVDAMGRPCLADYGVADLQGVRTAFIEMSAASGIWRVAEKDRRPREATTFGTGMLIRHAVEESRAERIYIGIGGSVTNDGGAGMAVALGVRFLDGDGGELDGSPGSLISLAAVDEAARLPLPELIVACDVVNPLCGGRGASAVFGPQKGASPEDVTFLDGALGQLADVSHGGEIARVPGAGAAGGLGFGLMRFAGARLVAGFDIVADALQLAGRIAAADLVITGEGSLDAQTLGGKGPAGVAAMARQAGKPVVAVAGRVEDAAVPLFDHVMSLERFGLERERSMAEAAQWLEVIVREDMPVLSSLLAQGTIE
ncbi:glycerate kinase [Luteolibacter sp. SL250]|uniref:glycerate kinase n=1 Tax=Luteolibacter sp. SL250 TaxID=2995170 RepID=UPI002270BB49|nr:glycerate kinase [Luteolibacter sp. SL250]WAC17966.1 glycerate kinase [Luteolibacter sp. SL250]